VINDGRQVDNGRVLECGICILGGGAAGITLACALGGTRQSIILVESGGLEPDREIQQLYTGINDGLFYSLDRTRLRYFGGSTNHWTGMCRPLTASELAPRSWIPDSGWPIGPDDLAPYYPEAQQICELGPYQYDSNYWQKKGLNLLDLSGGGFHNAVYQLGPPTRFGKRYRDDIRRARNVSVLLNANVTELVPDANGKTVQLARIRCLNGNAFSIKAATYVLALGGIENARVLLASNSIINTGLGNQHDNVGRYFMDHIRSFGVATIQAKTGSIDPSYYEVTRTDGTRTTTVFRLDPATEQQHQIAGFFTGFYTVRKTNAAYSYRTLHEYLAKGQLPPDLARHVDNIRSDPKAALEERSRLALEEKGFTDLYTTIDLIEQVPDRESRVRLSDQTDRLGMPKTLMHWRFGEMEKRTLYYAHRQFHAALKARGIGDLQTKMRDASSDWPQRVEGSAHHMGTTRMHRDPRHGVVDRNCKVFGVSNLFVAGSSVFTSGGTTNPTLTIVALALKLAARLRSGD